MNEITSRDNQWVKMACSLKQKKGRQAHQRVFVEGLRVFADASAMAIPDAICFVSEKGRALDGFEALYARGLELGWTFYAVTDSVYDKLKDTRTPQGLAAMLPFFAYTCDRDRAHRSGVPAGHAAQGGCGQCRRRPAQRRQCRRL